MACKLAFSGVCIHSQLRLSQNTECVLRLGCSELLKSVQELVCLPPCVTAASV